MYHPVVVSVSHHLSVGAGECMAMCRARPSCLSAAFDAIHTECRLSNSLPLLNNTEASNTTWLVSYRKIAGKKLWLSYIRYDSRWSSCGQLVRAKFDLTLT